MRSSEEDDELEELLEQLLAERRGGGAQDLEAILSRHPEHADRLRELLPMLELLERARDRVPESRAARASSTGASEPRVLDPRPAGRPLSAVLDRLAGRAAFFARYELRDEIGRGGQGAVLAVWDEDLRRSLAMKRLLGSGKKGSGAESRSLGRFLDEAQVTAQLDHPGIVPVHELGADPAGGVYFTMKLVRGRDLGAVFELARREEEGWTRTRVLGVLLKVCEALAYAHDKGVIHRDLKPSNVMVGRFGEVYVMDWGLARVLGSQDGKDLRIRSAQPSEVLSLRRAPDESSDSPLVTMDGDVLGTPAYMSPEQARGDIAAMGPQSDVYAVGAMLYELLAGHMPYVPTGSRLGNRAVWALVQQGPPATLEEVAAKAPAELAAICQKAMARDPRARYADVGALAEDLRAFLENRVVLAHRSGALVELRKWVRRNRALAASLATVFLAVVAGLVVSLAFKARADARAADVLQLSAIQDLEELTSEAEKLWPASPENVERYRGWLQRAEMLLARLPAYEARLAELRAEAQPWSEGDQDRYVADHSRRAELERERRRLVFLEQLAVRGRSGRSSRDSTPEEVGLDPATLPTKAIDLNQLAWPLVDPDRKDWGGEARGLVLARRALALAVALPAPERAGVRDTLAWALFAAGRFEEAVAEEEQALVEAAEADRWIFRSYVARMKADARDLLGPAGAEALEDLRDHVAELEEEIASRPEWAFSDSEHRWWHGQLFRLVEGLRSFAHPRRGLASSGLDPERGWGVRKRLEFAASVAELSVSGAAAARVWSEAIAEVAASPAYAGLRIEPQLGLLPIGRDPSSGLWEFAHLQTGDPAKRGADGRLLLEESSGLVFVLLPGGTFLQGAQAEDRAAPNYDPDARPDEKPRQETVAPFFLSKYEMTAAQWVRLTGHNPSGYGPVRRLRGGHGPEGEPWTGLHPVEQVTWDTATRVLAQLGLVLPSETQWEYGARGGTSTIYWTGNERESLRGAANLADQAAARANAPWSEIQDWPDLDDGYPVHAPVDRLRPNPFGLHHVLGNVWEWCRDEFEGGTRDPSDRSLERVGISRGGSFHDYSKRLRVAFRSVDSTGYAVGVLGLRPARELTH